MYTGKGAGSLSDPYQIATADQLNEIRGNYLEAGIYFKLTANIDLSDYAADDGWMPIGDRYTVGFKGNIDGNGYEITNVTINRRNNNYVGLFGFVDYGGSITNLIVKNMKVIGFGPVGGLVGQNNGTINNSYTTGSIEGGSSEIGGLVGENQGTISSSYSTGNVIGITTYGGGGYVGGLVGSNGGTISSSYATGNVNGGNYVGGLTGINQGPISNSYATGDVNGTSQVGGLVGLNYSGPISDSFYDKDTTGQSDTGKGEGKTTEEMKTQSTYEGWQNFSNTWAIDPLRNNEYPHLRVFYLYVTYDGNGNVGGSVPNGSKSYLHEDTVSVEANTGDLVKTGYTFVGWNTLADGSGSSYDSTSTFKITENTTLYAKWTLNNYTVSYEVNGGSEVSDVNADYDTTITEPTAPTKANYIFDGWYKETGLTTKWDFTTDKVVGDTTLYAKWTPINYAVSFVVDGGTEVADVNADYNTTITEPIAPTKENYSFDGWYKESELTTKWDFTTDKVTGATMLYAKWTPINYAVSFVVDGGSAVANVNADYNTTITEPTAPTKENYIFGGWYKESALTTKWDFTTNKVVGATTLYAKWTPINYAVSFVVDGGSAVANVNADYNTTITEPTAPTKANYIFGGWYKESALTTKWDFTTNKVVGDTTLYAKWTLNNNGGGGGGGSTPTPTPTVPTPTVPPTVPTEVPPVTPTTKQFYNEKVNIEVIQAIVEKANAAPAVTFKDVPASAPNAKAIELAAKVGIIKGNVDGAFHANATITRAEFATMLVRALGLTSEGDSSFKDTKGHWAADAIATLQASGIINGYVDGTFKPNQTITRAEIVSMLSKVMNITLVKNDKFKDVSGNWAEAEIDTLSDMGIVKGAADGSFKPNANATRSESLVMILRMLNASLGYSLDVE